MMKQEETSPEAGVNGDADRERASGDSQADRPCAFNSRKHASPAVARVLGDAPPNEPFRWVQGSDTLLIFIHGYLGSPDTFRELAARLYRGGYDCAAIRLPGHGGSVREFSRTGEAAWSSHVQAEIDRLRPGYQHTILVGHSLGCLLALDYAADHADSDPVDALILFCTPLRLRFGPFVIPISLSVTFRRPQIDDPVTAAYRLSYGLCQQIINPFALVRPAFALMRVMAGTRAKLGRVRAPTLIFQSQRDETASPKSAYEIAGKLGGYVHVHWLRRSRHAWIHPEELAASDAEIDRILEASRS